MERTKRISTQTLAIAILSLLLVASLVMSMTGAWFTDNDGLSYTGTDFGTVEISLTATDFNVAMTDPNLVIMPGDTVDIQFTVNNSGSAQMYARFSLDITVGALGVDVINTAIFNQLDLLADWTKNGNYYYYTGATDSILEPLDAHIVDTQFIIPTDLDEAYQGLSVEFTLVVQAIQVANNEAAVGTEPWGADWTDFV